MGQGQEVHARRLLTLSQTEVSLHDCANHNDSYFNGSEIDIPCVLSGVHDVSERGV